MHQKSNINRCRRARIHNTEARMENKTPNKKVKTKQKLKEKKAKKKNSHRTLKHFGNTRQKKINPLFRRR